MSPHADENEDDQVDVAAVGEAETTPIEKQRLFLKLTVAASIYIYIYVRTNPSPIYSPGLWPNGVLDLQNFVLRW